MSSATFLLSEPGSQNNRSADQLNVPTVDAYGHEIILSEKRRATDPGPAPCRHLVSHYTAGGSWAPPLPPGAVSDSSCSSRSLLTLLPSGLQNNQCPFCLDLLKCLKRRYKRLDIHTEKLLLLTSIPEHLVPDDALIEEFGCSRTLAYTAIELRRTFGPFSCCPPQFIQLMPNFVKTSIVEFFMESDNSGDIKVVHGGNEEGHRIQKRAMFVSLSELFQEYIYLYPFNRRTVTYSRFAHLIPSNVVWSKPFLGSSQEETCIVHENFQLLLSSCYHFYSEGIPRILNEIVCSTANPICMLGYCDKCKISRKVNQLTADYSLEERVEFYTWQSLHSYDSRNNRESLTFLMITEPLPIFNERLNTAIRRFLRHHFIFTEQSQYWQKMTSRLSNDRNLALVKMDFCEKFTCVSKVGPKSSKLISYDPQREVAIHPFHVVYYDEDKDRIGQRNFVVVSNDLREIASTSFLFRMELIQWMRRTLPQIKSLVYWSDDNAKNFKNSKHIINLLFHEEDFKMKAKHEFTVEGHAAQECTEVVTMIKRMCRRACLKGEAVITNALEMWKYCKKEFTVAGALEFEYLDRRVGRIKNLEMRLDRRYMVNNGIIPGIEQFYSFRPDYSSIRGQTDTIRVRRLSGSEEYQIIRVRLTGRQDDGNNDFAWHSMVSQKYGWDERRFQVGNIVTFSVEGVLFSGKIVGDPDVMKGKMEVLTLGRVEKVKAGRRIGEVNFDEGKIVEISSLDVVLVENADSIGAGGRSGSWGGGARKLLSGFGRRVMGGGSFRM